jgi:cysteine desulfurase
MSRIYLDNNATTPIHDGVVDAMLPFLSESFGNPSSTHAFGRETRRAIDRARECVADFVRAEPGEIVFTSGGTEANNHAIRGVVESRTSPTHLVTGANEHPAVLETCKALSERGASVTVVPVDGAGSVTPEGVAAALTDDTSLISIMLANNDVGTIQPVAEIARLARERGILTHTDAVQAPGKIPIDVRQLGVDLLSISAHKSYGPKGTGALFVRDGTKLDPLLFGGSHEQNKRAGTENVAGIVGLGKACEIAAQDSDVVAELRSLRDHLERGILESIEGTGVNGSKDGRLPNTTNICFHGVRSDSLLMNLDLEGIAVSAGSACASGAVEPSHVLLAMGLSRDDANSSLRFSLGRGNSPEQVERVLEVLVRIVARLRGS